MWMPKDCEERRVASVLVVESDQDLLRKLLDRLAVEGIEAIGASSAAEALAVLGREGIGIVVTELHLPDRDGVRFLEEVRAAQHQLCLIVHSDGDFHELAKALLHLGIFAYVEKKDGEQEVIQTIHRACAAVLSQYAHTLEGHVAQRTADLHRQVERLVKLHEMVMRVHRCTERKDIYDAAIDMMSMILGVDRCAILLFDSDGVMRFKAWRGLSESYRRAIEGHGHGPWHPHTVRATPVLVSDVQAEPTLTSYQELFRQEGIGALAFIPLSCSDEGRILGKMMLYAPVPLAWPEENIRLAQVIADHVVAALLRIQAEELLRRSYRQREQFCLDLHDGILQSLYAVGLQLQIARRDVGSLAPPMVASLEKVVGQIDGIIKNVREFIEFVRNGKESVKKHTDLGEALEELIAGLESLDTGEIERRLVQAKQIVLSAEQMAQVLYIVKEALSNSLRHSHARRRWVILRPRRSGLCLEVGDDGVGFTFNGKSAGGDSLGLLSMISRAERIGGQVTIRTGHGKGTRVLLDLPLGDDQITAAIRG